MYPSPCKYLASQTGGQHDNVPQGQHNSKEQVRSKGKEHVEFGKFTSPEFPFWWCQKPDYHKSTENYI